MPLLAATVSLAWDPPPQYMDGDTEADLAGYRLYYGTESGIYSNHVVVMNGTSTMVSNLPSGYTYYFAVTAFNSAGGESDLSEELELYLPPAIVLSTTSLVVGETRRASVPIRLDAPPLDATTVLVCRVNGSSPWIGVVAGGKLVFTPTNWFVEQTVTFRAYDDSANTQQIARFTFSGAGVSSTTLPVWFVTASPTDLYPIEAQEASTNGVPDIWKVTRMGGTDLVGANDEDDPDHDGVSNLAEYIAGTEPLDAESRLRVEIYFRNGRAEVWFQTVAATGPGYVGRIRCYTLQQCTSLTTGAWTPVAAVTEVLADGQAVTQPVDSGQQEACFYRVTACLK